MWISLFLERVWDRRCRLSDSCVAHCVGQPTSATSAPYHEVILNEARLVLFARPKGVAGLSEESLYFEQRPCPVSRNNRPKSCQAPSVPQIPPKLFYSLQK